MALVLSDKERKMTDPTQNPGHVDSALLDRVSSITNEHKQRMLERLKIRPGLRLLDVGCGPGTDMILIAQLAGEDCLIVGMDYDESMIREASERVRAAKVANHTKPVIANVLSIPCRSSTFDICISERLFQHVDDNRTALREIIRVTKAGGSIAIADADWCTLSIDTMEIDIERRITRALPRLLCNGYAGRQLFRLFKELDLLNVQVEVNPIIWTDYYEFRDTSLSMKNLNRKLVDSGAITEGELHCFFRSLEEAHKCGSFFATASVILVTGVKPG